ncbi:MAG: glycosyltransferase, partial [Roseibium sp.]|uniref:glycosyltransferase n=1 Tax=Roseibium sp. TaxID=1936156 RepID=UPI00262DB42B
VERFGNEAPALLLIGRRGWESETAVDLLERCEQLKGHVFELGGLSNDSLQELMAGASGCLMPSLVEGFSLPMVEAMAMGIPTIASDISVHRELAEPSVRLVDPLDGPTWIQAIMSQADGSCDGNMASDAQRAQATYTWENHFRVLESVLVGARE